MGKFSETDIRSGIAVAICFFISGVINGTARLSGLLFLASITRYNVDRGKASFPFLLCYAVRNGLGPLVGFFGRKFGLKAVTATGGLVSSVSIAACFFAEDIVTVAIIWGLVFGFGFALGTLLLPEILSIHFSKHLDKANGIYLAGETAMSFLLSPVTEFSLKKYELSGTFLILSGVALHSFPAALLFRMPENSTATANQGEEFASFTKKNGEKAEDKNDKESNNIVGLRASIERDEVARKSAMHIFKVFLDPVYVILLLTNCSVLYIYNTIATIIVDIAIDHGVSTDEEVYILMGFFMTVAIGCLFLGSLTDGGCLSKINFSAMCLSGVGVLLIACVFVNGFTGMMVCAVLLGLCVGGLIMISAGVATEYVDNDCIGVALASRYALYAPLSFTQSPLIGYFRDTLGSYNGLLYILICVCCACTILLLLVPPTYRRREIKKRQLKMKQST